MGDFTEAEVMFTRESFDGLNVRRIGSVLSVELLERQVFAKPRRRVR